MVDKLKEKNEELLKKYIDEENKEKIYRHKIIKALLLKDDCFIKMSMEDIYNILDDLGYEKEEFKDIYMSLASSKEYKKYIEGE